MPEEIDENSGKEIARLWAKVASYPNETPDTLPPSMMTVPVWAAGDVAWETVALLKKRYGEQRRYWAKILETKESSLKSCRERQGSLEREVQALRRRIESCGEESIKEMLELQAKMEALLSAVNEERARHEEEKKTFKILLEQMRQEIQEIKGASPHRLDAAAGE